VPDETASSPLPDGYDDSTAPYTPTEFDTPGQPLRVDWFAIVIPGFLLIAIAAWMTLPHLSALPAAFWVIAAQAVFFELRPILATRQQPEGILVSTAFLFAIEFLWGPWPAVLVMAVANGLAQARGREPIKRGLFTIAMLAWGFSSAGATMALIGVRPTIAHPLPAMRASDLVWMLAAWSVHFLVVHFLVNGGAVLIRDRKAMAYVRSEFSVSFWFYVISDLVIICTAPLVVILAQNASAPFLLLLSAPFAAVWKGADFSRAQEDEALHDMLTGLPNRRLFFERSAELLAAARPGERFALLLVDLDGFKEVNDRLGHYAGDVLLREVGDRVRACVGQADVAARLGGDEFAVLVNGITDPGAGVYVAQRLRDALQAPFSIEGETLHIDGSTGISVSPEHGQDIGELLRCADIAMYVAKRGGLGVSVYFDGETHDDSLPGRGRSGRRAADLRTDSENDPTR
jgi:diguanylate cyclase (GGDEF)-like protein